MRSVHVYASVELDEVLSEFTTDEILGAMRMRDGQEHSLACAIHVGDTVPKFLECLGLTQAAHEKEKRWAMANAVGELREAIQAAWQRYKAT